MIDLQKDLIEKGNLVYVNDTIYVLKEIGKNQTLVLSEWGKKNEIDIMVNSSKAEGIVIYDELLVKLGFLVRNLTIGNNTINDYSHTSKDGNFTISIKKLSEFPVKWQIDIVSMVDGSNSICTAIITYIHELQNIVKIFTKE